MLKNKKVDMHVHSIFSLGGTKEKPHATETVEQILERAEDTGIGIISITDHETTMPYQYILEHPNVLSKFSGEIVPAVEVSSSYNGIITHIMLYGFKLKDSRIIDSLPSLIKARNSTSVEKHKEHTEELKRICDKLGLSYDQDFTATMLGQSGHDSFCNHILSRKENITRVDENGIGHIEGAYQDAEGKQKIFSFSNIREFYYENLIDKENPWFIDFSKDIATLQEVYAEVKQVDPNIIVSLNHIGIYPLKQSYLSFIEEIRPYIDGIETMHWGHTAVIEEECNKAATETGLYTFGGSDFHNPKDHELGKCDNGAREVNSSRLRLPENLYTIHGTKGETQKL